MVTDAPGNQNSNDLQAASDRGPTGRGLARALSASAGGDLAAKAAILAAAVIAARLLEPGAFAVYIGLQATAVVAAAVWDSGVSTLVVTQASHGIPFGLIARRVVRLRVLALPIWIVAMVVGLTLIGRVMATEPVSLVMVGVGSIAASSSIPVLAWLRGRLRFGRAAGSIAVGRWTTTAIAAALLFEGPQAASLSQLLVANAVGELAIVVIGLLAVRSTSSDGPSGWDRSTIGLRVALPYAANTILSIVYNRLDILLVASLTTAAQLAAYAPASRIQDALYILPTALAAVSLPYMSRMFRAPSGIILSRALLFRVWAVGLAIAIPAAILTIVAMPQVIEVLLGPDYLPAVEAARILTLSIVVASLGAPVLALLIAAGRGSATTKAFAVAFAISLSLHLLLDPRLGAIGAAIASVTRDFVNLSVAVWLARDLLRGSVRPGLDDSADEAIEAAASSRQTGTL